MSFAIRQRFGVLSGGVENFLHDVKEKYGDSEMATTLQETVESCNISKLVLDDFSICVSGKLFWCCFTNVFCRRAL